MPVPTCSEFQIKTSPAASTRFAAVPDSVIDLRHERRRVHAARQRQRRHRTVDPDPAAPLLMSDTVRLFVSAPVIADGVTYCTDVTVAGNGATNTGVFASAPPLTAAATTCREEV
jgi:hypothetical protein